MVLVYAIVLSIVLHFGLLYIPFFQNLFAVIPLNWNEWKAVLMISLPVMYVSLSLSLSLSLTIIPTCNCRRRCRRLFMLTGG